MAWDRQFNIILFDLDGTLVNFQWRLEETIGDIIYR